MKKEKIAVLIIFSLLFIFDKLSYSVTLTLIQSEKKFEEPNIYALQLWVDSREDENIGVDVVQVLLKYDVESVEIIPYTSLIDGGKQESFVEPGKVCTENLKVILQNKIDSKEGLIYFACGIPPYGKKFFGKNIVATILVSNKTSKSPLNSFSFITNGTHTTVGNGIDGLKSLYIGEKEVKLGKSEVDEKSEKINADIYSKIISHFGMTENDPNWDPSIDFNNDGLIDVSDLSIFVSNMEKE